MATLALGALGASLGTSLLPSGIGLFGLSVSGATIGSQVGSILGATIDGALFGQKPQRGATAPRLETLHVTGSAEGTVIPRVYGRARIGGQLLWATDIIEEIGASQDGGKSQRSADTDSNDYRYYANFAVGLCEGPIAGLGRVWADGKPFDLSRATTRLYQGTADQQPDPLIAQHMPDGIAPAFRDCAYIVFEHVPLAAFGNRIPQLSFEVFRPLDEFNAQVKALVVIPGTGEFAYEPTAISRKVGLTSSVPENTNTSQGPSDWSVAMDQMAATFPNTKSVSLVVSWFGDDLRVGLCSVAPRVEQAEKLTVPMAWSVAGLLRSNAQIVSKIDGKPAYGGTPSDASVVAAIRDLKARGLSVTLNPFLLMDIPANSGKPDPYAPSTDQPPYPWRGRITCSPAPGQAGTPDKTTTLDAQIAPFVGTVLPSHYSVVGDSVVFTGPSEWSYRRMILHYAHLAKAAGGVDTFLLGSELRGLTTLRNAPHAYPFVSALVALAQDVKSILGPTTKITYAADWSEYFGHQPADASGDVSFHLDPLWSSPAIAAVGIDVYWPLADWRHTSSHLDKSAGFSGPHDKEYLKSNLVGGEGFDWYYASSEARTIQSRSPITDGLGKPWIYRFKDLKSWWQNQHFNRTAGIEQSSPTTWVPQSKPFWLMELGCPAVDLGANQPNVFIDPKSAESAAPHFSTKERDDSAQRRFLSAWVEAFDADHPGYIPGSNPVSAVYGAPMIDLNRLYLYAWDARPYPAFPNRTNVWADGTNWTTGHWLNGRGTAITLSDFVDHTIRQTATVPSDSRELTDTIDGVVINRLSSPRDILDPLATAFAFDAIERDGAFVFRARRNAPPPLQLTDDDLVETRPDQPLKSMTRLQETDLPIVAKVIFASADADYPQATVEARRSSATTDRVTQSTLPLVLEPHRAAALADKLLHAAWAERDSAQLSLPPSALALEPGDLITIHMRAMQHTQRIIEIGDGATRTIEARSFDRSVYEPAPPTYRPTPIVDTPAQVPPNIFLLDIPPEPSAPDHDLVIAAAQRPWPGPLAVYASADPSALIRTATIKTPSIVGVTLSPWSAGPEGRLDYANSLDVRIESGLLSSSTDLSFLNGANTVAIETASNVWEVVQFKTAVLIAPDTYRLSTFLRAQRGTEHAIPPGIDPVPPGANFVVLSKAAIAAGLSIDDLNRALQWHIGPTRDAVGDPTYQLENHTPLGVGLKPLSPVHIRGTRDAAGNLSITWVRRARRDADRWDAPEIPLGEEVERYELDILASHAANAAVLRTFQVEEPSCSYSATQQATDFGSLPSATVVRVAQLSRQFGRGWSRTATV